MTETIRYDQAMECVRDWKERNSLCNLVYVKIQTNGMKNILHSYKHRKIIWCNNMRTHQISHHTYMYGMAVTFSPLTFLLLLLHSLWIRIHFHVVVVELHVVLYTVRLFIQLMVLFWNGSLFDCQSKATLTLNIVNARIVVCWRCYCYCLWILLSSYSASLFV